MTHIAGKTGDVFIATTIIEDCEDSWTNGTHGAATAGDPPYVKVGSHSAKCIISGQADLDMVMYETLAVETNYTGFTHALCWAYFTGTTTTAADFQLHIDSVDELPDGNSETQLDFPVLTQNTWRYCRLTTFDSKPISASTAALAVGLQMHANHQSATIYLDDIRAAKIVAGINSWSLDYTVDALETSDFQSAGVKSYIAGGSGWSGSFSGYKSGAPLSIGSQYGIELAESATVTQMWLGTIIIMAVHPSVGFDGVVSYSYDFQGSGVLQIAST